MPFLREQRIVIIFVLSSVYQLVGLVLVAIISGDQEVRETILLKPLLPARTAPRQNLNLLFLKFYKEGISAPLVCYPLMGLIEIHHLLAS